MLRVTRRRIAWRAFGFGSKASLSCPFLHPNELHEHSSYIAVDLRDSPRREGEALPMSLVCKRGFFSTNGVRLLSRSARACLVPIMIITRFKAPGRGVQALRKLLEVFFVQSMSGAYDLITKIAAPPISGFRQDGRCDRQDCWPRINHPLNPIPARNRGSPGNTSNSALLDRADRHLFAAQLTLDCEFS